ncbi:hypothetical protein NQ318_012327 [Aromia moschata]|uniref:Uncharacterized protein n=1 Tax=Aromia moschata TaxID=1265417 RepID=A0AAV8YM52_9CUCU|nr:hypothetical protein NQ318_012327 [Aromia moschata]
MTQILLNVEVQAVDKGASSLSWQYRSTMYINNIDLLCTWQLTWEREKVLAFLNICDQQWLFHRSNNNDDKGWVQNYKRFASNLSLADDDLPVTATNRKLTDKYFLLGFLTCVLILAFS